MRIDKRWLIAGVAAAAVAAGSVGVATAVATDEPTGPGEVVAQTQEDTQQADDGRKTDDFSERRHDRPDSATAPDVQRDGDRGPVDRGGDTEQPRGPRADGDTDEGDRPARPERGPRDEARDNQTRDERGPGAHHRDHDGDHHAPQDADEDAEQQDGAGI
ncbi:hypothetical protein [Rhodococcus sp. NPDC047139]|uniref:hypothetical protein n=1 Tax=Rhodococcus sp. NPDC047139 TaxID=3155141 RepID=UPI0033FB26C4